MKFVFRSNQHDPGSIQNRLAAYFWCQNSQKPQNGLDVTFICSSGSISAHKFILEAASPVISRILQGDDISKEDHATILVPDTNVSLVQKCIQLIYTGAASCHGEADLKEAVKFCMDQLNMIIVADKTALGHNAPHQLPYQQQQQVQMNRSPKDKATLDAVSYPTGEIGDPNTGVEWYSNDKNQFDRHMVPHSQCSLALLT
jgi:hypothetical protein